MKNFLKTLMVLPLVAGLSVTAHAQTTSGEDASKAGSSFEKAGDSIGKGFSDGWHATTKSVGKGYQATKRSVDKAYDKTAKDFNEGRKEDKTETKVKNKLNSEE